MSKFLTYWSLTFAIVVIWVFSVAVALADVKDQMLDKIQRQWVARGKARLRPADPLAGVSVAETLSAPARTESQEWVFTEVSRIAESLRLAVGIVVLQDSMDHFLVHFTQGKRLVTYRVDKAWVADARAGKADQLERMRKAVEQYLRAEFLGEKPAPPVPPAATPSAQPGQPAAAAGTREEMIAAAKAKADAIKAERERAAKPPEGATD